MSDESKTQPEIKNPIAVAAIDKVETKNSDPDPACCTSPPTGDPGDTKG